MYHLHVTHRQVDRYLDKAMETFGKQLPPQHTKVVGLDDISDQLVKIITEFAAEQKEEGAADGGMKEINWL